MKRFATAAIIGVVTLAGALAQRAGSAEQAPAEAGTVRSITLPDTPTMLPDGPGREVVTTHCVLCHSPRYILDQPRFPRATWTTEVDKMRKTFGAPVPDAQAAQVVDYLVAIRGAAPPATQP